MELSQFILEYLNGDVKKLGDVYLDCACCPLREACQADEDARTKTGLEAEGCGDFLARMLTT